ncbi:sensor histidine kinase [Streptococcus minor]|uniref:sensor histidine kinase n=1 Tax=Streptococcus minor TaxID=229549 RepID=UPI00036AD54A|nr:sensor histidine kinase [Streptococcus minor]
MFRAFQKTDPLYYVGLVFMVFPLGGVAWFGYPTYSLLPSFLFVIAYIAIIHLKENYRKTIALLWFYLLFYIIWISTTIEGSMMWFFFYLGNLVTYRFEDSNRSYRFISFLIGLFGTASFGIFFVDILTVKLMSIVICLFILAMVYFQRKSLMEDRIQQKLYQQNKTINLLAAENERNRIGRDLHDTLGHTFAMITLKTELALKQLDKENLTAVRKELNELNQISQKSMKDVRQLVNNLKYRTVTEELENIRDMFALSDILLEIENTVNTDQLSPVIQSSITMILRELTTNIIKHAKANYCKISLKQNNKITILVSDNGQGFPPLTGQELHSIKERLQLVKGEVDILSPANPTTIRVVLKEGEMP